MAGDTVVRQEKRVALVTGAMGGLGTALCRRLHADGFLVAATHSPQNARRNDWLASQEADGVKVRAYELDVSNGNACENVVRRVLGDLGRIDVLVNNAGITRDRSMRKMSQEDWHTVMGTNLDSVFHMSRPVLEAMIAQRWGRIINISSVNGQQGAFGQANYAAAKAGMHGFTKSLALEVARHGVTVNTVSPGYLDTAMVEKVPQDVLRDRILPQIPVGRLGKPAEVAGLVAYLVSDLAGYLTGANIAINGGQHMY
ncbi:acetoacetyl-CoA reductase [Massilia sp. CFBP9012]|uniref:acetoacetyl-CoA reductase n=1 Tax=Massilia sp. CFBP9012 TaxID=3096531 RepID=UPI002A6997A3|nr:acetoacetyl-CoA reductase [Massilia sp. CFBP9012]MDY0978447.1 acetoacetyl-CoA reductase [Massilia sp. CFBP9012]